VPDVTVESPLSLGGRNTLGNATRCGRDTRTASGLCQLWSKESGNCANNHGSNQKLIHDALLRYGRRKVIKSRPSRGLVNGLRLSREGAAARHRARDRHVAAHATASTRMLSSDEALEAIGGSSGRLR